jgi:hypothetical protein
MKVMQVEVIGKHKNTLENFHIYIYIYKMGKEGLHLNAAYVHT